MVVMFILTVKKIMSKKNRKTNHKRSSHPKKKSHKKQIFAVIISLAIIAVCVISAILIKSCYDSSDFAQLSNSSWIPVSAKNSSDDEVELAEIYNNNYTSYQGSLSFLNDSAFSLWLTPGEPDDGTHSGIYTFADEDTVNLKFDEGTETQLKIFKSENTVTTLALDYGEYTIYFENANDNAS